MKQDLYEKLSSYIVRNQDRFYRLAFSYVESRTRWTQCKMRSARRWSIMRI